MAEPFLKGGSKVLERLLDLENVALLLGSSVNLDMAEPRRRVLGATSYRFFLKLVGQERAAERGEHGGVCYGVLLVLRLSMFIT